MSDIKNLKQLIDSFIAFRIQTYGILKDSALYNHMHVVCNQLLDNPATCEKQLEKLFADCVIVNDETDDDFCSELLSFIKDSTLIIDAEDAGHNTPYYLDEDYVFPENLLVDELLSIVQHQ